MQGQIIAGFELQERLGEGGAGTVWKARQISLERMVAIKILTDQLADNPADIEQFKLEARAAAQLKHTGIVQVYDFGEDAGVYFFAMEYIKGYSVGDWLERKGTLSEEDTLMVASSIAEALGYSWEKTQLIHRDIKPDNVLVDEDGTIKVVDLGLVKVLAADGETSFESENMCTPNYCSPQQADGGELDFRTDVYSLGCMMYHMLTGKLPFGEYGPHEVLDHQVEGQLPDPRTHAPKISTATALLLQKMLAKSASARQTTWEEVTQDIEHCMEGRNPSNVLTGDVRSTLKYDSTLNAGSNRSASGRIVKVDRERLHHRDTYTRAATPQAPQKSKSPTAVTSIVSIIIAIVLVGGGLFALQYLQKSKANKALADKTARMTTLLIEATDFIKENPKSWEESTQMLQDVINRSAGTPVQESAKSELGKLSERRNKGIKSVMKKLDQQAKELVRSKDFIAAMNCYKLYSGPLAKETASQRNKMVLDLEPRAIKQADAQREKLINGNNAAPTNTTTQVDEPQDNDTPKPTIDVNPGLPPELLPYKEKFDDGVKLADGEYLLEFTKVLGLYKEALKNVKDEGQQNGILNIVTAVEQEEERVDADGTLPRRLIDGVPASVKVVMARGAQHRARLEAKRNGKLDPIKTTYLNQLRAIQRKLTSEDRINDARAVQEIADNLEKRSIPLPTR